MAIYNKHCCLLSRGNHPCSFCGGRMSHGLGGHWSAADSQLLCCTHCAQNVLPAFLADSLHARNLSEAQYTLMGRVMATLQRAFASRAEWKNWNGLALIDRFNSQDAAEQQEIGCVRRAAPH